MKKQIKQKLKLIEKNLSSSDNLSSMEVELDKKTFKTLKKYAKQYDVTIEVYMNYMLRQIILDKLKSSEDNMIDSIDFAELINKNGLNEELDGIKVIDYITSNIYKITKE